MIQTGGSSLTVGLALGAGASHGWAHIGVLRTLIGAGIVPDVIIGCSAGALVGAYYGAGKLDKLEDWARTQTVANTMSHLRLKRGYSLFGSSLFREMAEDFRGIDVEDLRVRFGAVATHLRTGDRKVFTEGPLARAVAASGAFPLLFPPVKVDGAWYVDGCLTDPVPAELCLSLGVDIVIGVRVHKKTEQVHREVQKEVREWYDLMREDIWEDTDGPPDKAMPREGVLARLLDTLSPTGARRMPGLAAITMQSLRALHRGKKGRRRSANAADVCIAPRLGLLRLGSQATALTIERGAHAAAQHVPAIYAAAQRVADERAHAMQPRAALALAHRDTY